MNIIYIRIPDRHFQAISINDKIMRYYEKIDGLFIYWVTDFNNLESLLIKMDPKSTIIFWGAFYQNALKYKDFFHVGQLGDHPFSDWIRPVFKNIPNNIYITYIEQGYSNAINLISPSFKSHTLVPGIVIDYHSDSDRDENLNKKEIDYIIAMNLRSEYSDIYSKISNIKSKKIPSIIYRQLLDVAIDDKHNYITDTFKLILQSNNIDWKSLSHTEIEECLSCIHKIDMYIRYYRRIVIIKDFIKKLAYSKKNILAITNPHVHVTISTLSKICLQVKSKCFFIANISQCD